MILQPAVIALLFVSFVCVVMLFAAAPAAYRIVRNWDIRSGCEGQIILERQTYLLSTLLVFVFLAQIVATLLFVFNADKMSSLFVGAMCAVGTLQVNAFGFPSLLAQLAVFFLGASWLVINHVDTRAYDYPLINAKYKLFLAILPVVLLSAALQYRFFQGLKADVITSCCGSLFSEDTVGVLADATALPVVPSMVALGVSLVLTVLACLYFRRHVRGGILVAIASCLTFVIALLAIVSFVSLYIYEHPHHHCPFCVLKPEYGYQGYLLYLPLFGAAASGLGIGVIQPFSGIKSLIEIIPAVSRRLALAASILWAVFALVVVITISKSNLVLLVG